MLTNRPLASSVFYELNGTQYDGFPFLVNVSDSPRVYFFVSKQNALNYQIFNFYPDEPNFITFLLSRSNIGITQGGVMTIGAFLQELSASYSAF